MYSNHGKRIVTLRVLKNLYDVSEHLSEQILVYPVQLRVISFAIMGHARQFLLYPSINKIINNIHQSGKMSEDIFMLSKMWQWIRVDTIMKNNYSLLYLFIQVKNGYIRRIMDEEIMSLALEIAGTNVATTYIFCPADPKKVLAIRLPFLIIIIKNMKKYFTFEITVKPM